MKNIRTAALCVCLSFLGFGAAAQTSTTIPINEPDYNKPKMFDSFPEQIPFNVGIINHLLSASVGTGVDLNIGDGVTFRLAGQVVSTASKYQQTITSVVIRCQNFNGASLTITKIVGEDGTITYKGRMMSKQHGDLYELQNLNGQLTLVKRKFYDLVNE
jgi:hypothetical protein